MALSLLSAGGSALLPVLRERGARLGSAHRRTEASPSAQGRPSATLVSQDEVYANRPEAAPEAPPLLPTGVSALTQCPWNAGYA